MAETTWLFGLPCSGKSTLAEGLVGPETVHLDGDYLRETLNEDLGFSKADRSENLRRAAGVAEALNEQGFDVVASFITPYRDQRDTIRDTVENVSFVHVDTPLEVCEERDVKGMYEKARRGEIEDFTGISDPFEEPAEDADVLSVGTVERSRSESLRVVNEELDRKLDPAHLFVGRWQPFHDGHRRVIDAAAADGEQVVVAIRDTELSEEDPLTVGEREELIEQVYGDHPNVETTVVPDVEAVAVDEDADCSVFEVSETTAAEDAGTRDEYEKEELLAGAHLDD